MKNILKNFLVSGLIFGIFLELFLASKGFIYGNNCRGDNRSSFWNSDGCLHGFQGFEI